LLRRLVESGGSGVCVRRLGGTRAGEIRLTRFLRNPAVGVEEMVGEAALALTARCAGRRVLAIQDTTVVRCDEKGSGLFLHAVLAVDADDGAILGLADACFVTREAGRNQVTAAARRKVTPFENKQSARWLAGASAVASAGGSAKSVTVIADRESDIFDLFEQRPDNVDLLVRAKHDRTLGDGGGRMFARIDARAEDGHASLDLQARPGQRARTALMAVRFMEIDPVRPGGGGAATIRPSGVRFTLVDVREVDPPPSTAPLHWRLLTTLPVESAGQAFAVADLYRRRWAIEQVFRTLKTEGFDIEGLAIADERPRRTLTMASLIAAVVVQQLVHARDGASAQTPQRPLSDAFESGDAALLQAYTAHLEGKTARQKNPHPRGSLAYAAWVCARLGGWTGYYGKPGPIVMLRGWLTFQAAKQGASLMVRLV
jgi:hypothetical protein